MIYNYWFTSLEIVNIIKFDIIQVVTVPLITTATCQSSAYYGAAVTSNMICAGEAGKDSCTVCSVKH